MNTSPLPSNVLAVIFDISGTVLDYGSRGPVAAFVELFARHGVAVNHDEARRPMGTHKIDHIKELLADPEIAGRWRAANGMAPSPGLADAMYAEFTALQMEVLPSHCGVIPGVPETVGALRTRGIAIANTTGFDTAMMTDLIRLAGEGGYTPDVWVCPDEVGKGRPAPWMIHHAARQLGLFPLSAFVKVGDTPADVAEARAAGVWCVSVVLSGNEVGLSLEEMASMPPDDLAARVSAARARLAACGPHFLIDSVADLIPVIDEISARIARGEKP
jgi:phosphonoacetaldehyde hydrolase